MSSEGRRELVLVGLAVAVVVAWGAAAGGVGFLNGDAAAYLAQVAQGDLGQRQVHLGYLLLASQLQGLGELERVMDGISTGAVALGVLGAAASVRSGEGSPGYAAAGTAAVLLPLAAHAEVDPVWIAAVLWARALPAVAAAAVFAVGITISPVALLAGPWVVRGERARARWIAAGALLAVLALTWWTGGDWWVGDRGVWASGWPRPVRAIRAWATLMPWALLPLALASDRRVGPELLAWLPLLLAPPDVPAWAVPAVGLVIAAARGGLLVPPPVALLALGIELAIGGFLAGDVRERVKEEDRLARELATELGPRDGLIAPFTWGARVSVRGSGDPYGLRWRPPEGFLRDQEGPWCAAPPAHVWRLPPVDGEPVALPVSDPAVRADCP